VRVAIGKKENIGKIRVDKKQAVDLSKRPPQFVGPLSGRAQKSLDIPGSLLRRERVDDDDDDAAECLAIKAGGGEGRRAFPPASHFPRINK
jgi:hypothetical protein